MGGCRSSNLSAGVGSHSAAMTYRQAKAAVGCVLALMLAGGAPRPVSAGAKQDVINSPHNLSASGPGAVKSSQTQVCIFCHAPHNVQPDITPLWNHAMPAQSYNPYASSTLKATAQMPSVVSKQCLSCHDGTIGLGQTIANGLIATTGSLSASANLGTDLRNDHPFSFTLVNNGELSPSLF